MSDLFEDPAPQGNQPEFTVTELSGAVKRVIEGKFGRVLVRGEIGRVSRPATGCRSAARRYRTVTDRGALWAARVRGPDIRTEGRTGTRRKVAAPTGRAYRRLS
jgi:exodeoxyribonuclease VII large subunit